LEAIENSDHLDNNEHEQTKELKSPDARRIYKATKTLVKVDADH
jgi:hypothetical protein